MAEWEWEEWECMAEWAEWECKTHTWSTHAGGPAVVVSAANSHALSNDSLFQQFGFANVMNV